MAHGEAEPVRRIGDLNAPRWTSRRLDRFAIPIAITASAFAVGVLAYGAWRAFQSQVATHIIGVSIGLALVVLMLAIGLCIYVRYSEPIKRAVSEARASNPGSLVHGGRLPGLEVEVVEGVWPTSLAPIANPQKVVCSRCFLPSRSGRHPARGRPTRASTEGVWLMGWLALLALLLPPIALLSFTRLSVLQAKAKQSRGSEPVAISEVLQASGRIAADLVSGRSKAGLFELILLSAGSIAAFVLVISGLASLPTG